MRGLFTVALGAFAAALALFPRTTLGEEEPPIGATIDAKEDHCFPACSAVIDVTKPPYSAAGDGKTDDTAVIQKALDDMMGQHKVLYFPNGDYLISATLRWSNHNANGQPAWGFNWIQGQNAVRTSIRLADNTFTDPNAPKAMMWCGGFGSADWFHNYVQGLTFDTGRGNAGAIGLQFYSNNVGAVRDVIIGSRDGNGLVGLDLAHRDMNGPLLVSDVYVKGFDFGIRTGGAVNSQTFERITLEKQNQAGFDNNGQAIAIRGLLCKGSPNALRTYGTLSLLNARLSGGGDSSHLPAMVNCNGGRIAIRDVTTSGFARAISDVVTPDFATALRVSGADKPGSLGPDVGEYFSHTPVRPFAAAVRSLRLAVEETPTTAWENPSHWANVDRFGADPSGNEDSADAIQRAIDSGATTVFFPGCYRLSRPVSVRGNVERLLGVGNWIDYNKQSPVDFVIVDGQRPTVAIEHFAPINGGIEIRTSRTVVLRSLESRTIGLNGLGRVFLEDVSTDHLQVHPRQQVWARQLNIENEGDHLVNDGGSVWILGYKTERGGTLVRTLGGGKSEVFGNFSYTTTAGKLGPMFDTVDSDVFAFFSEVCFSGDPFATLVRESRHGQVRQIDRQDGPLTPYIGVAPVAGK